MADDKKMPDEPFLKRWARRKADVASAEPVPEDPGVETASPAGAPPGAPPAPAAPDSAPEEPEIDLAALPDIDSLDERSDFSVFMQNGIPEELRTRALQRLWRLDPSFGHIDGLLEYGEDFTGTGLAAEAVNTLYKVGKGMVSEEADTADADAAATAEDTSEDAAAAAVPHGENEPENERENNPSGALASDDSTYDPKTTG